MDNNAVAGGDLPSRRGRVGVVASLGVLVALLAGGWFFLNPAGSGAAPAMALADLGTVPDVRLTERSGRAFGLGELKGKVWVANFIFTRCGGSCPGMSAKMSDLQETLREAGDVKLVSFTVDPQNDTPEQLANYANGYNADKDKWLFLTGDAEQMQTLAKESFRLAIEEGTDPKEPILHSRRFVLVDRDGHIRGYYNSEEPEGRERLLKDIKTLTEGDA